MSSVIVSRIPDGVGRDDIVRLISNSISTKDVKYVLYPLGKDLQKALVAFSSSKVAENCVRLPLEIAGHRLKMRPAPRQTYQRITAEVDPLIVASVPDLEQCMHFLEQTTGTDVTYSTELGVLTLTGSLLQIQCAQTYLDAIFQQQQEVEARALLLMEQDLETPRSERSLADDDDVTPTFEHQLMNKLRAQQTKGDRRVGKEKPQSGMASHGPIKATTESQSYTKPQQSHRGTLAQGIAGNEEDVTRNGHSARSKSAGSVRHKQDPNVNAEAAYDQKAPVHAWGEKSLAKPPSDKPSVTLELDLHVMTFIRKIHKQEVQGMETKYDAVFFFKSTDDVMKTRMVSNLSEEEGGYQRLEELREEFIAFYQTVFYSVVKETLHYDEDSVTRQDVDALVVAVSKAFASRVHIDDKNRGQILLVGSWEFVSLVLDWIKKKLGLTPPDDNDELGATAEPFAQTAGPMELQASRQSELMSSEETKQSMASTWSGQPTKSTKGPKSSRESTATKIQRSSSASMKQASNGSLRNSLNASQGSAYSTPYSTLGASGGGGTLLGETFGTVNSIPSGPHSDVTDMVVRGTPAPRTSDLNLSNGRSTHTPYSVKPGTVSAPPPVKPKILLKHVTEHQIHVTVMAGDITKIKADVIVNASNETLHHIGTIAAAINQAAGPGFQEVCSKYVAKNGGLKVTEVVSTPAQGRLRCGHVIHAVGPMWSLYDDKGRCTDTVRRTFLSALHYANNKLKATSIVLPAIGTGIYGVPLDVCARVMYEALQSFGPTASCLRDVIIVDLEEEAAGMIAIIFQQLVELKAEEADPAEGSETASVTEVKDLLSAVALEQTGEMEPLQTTSPRHSESEADQAQQILDASPIQAARIGDQFASLPNSAEASAVIENDLVVQDQEEGPVSPPPTPEEEQSAPGFTGPVIQASSIAESFAAPAPMAKTSAEVGDYQIQDEEGPASPPPTPEEETNVQGQVSHADDVTYMFDTIPRGHVTESDGDLTPRSLVSDAGQAPLIQANQVNEIFASAPKPPGSESRTPRSGFQTPVSGTKTPSKKGLTPLSGQKTPRSEQDSVRSGQQTPQSLQHTPRSGQQTPRSGQQTPRTGQQTPISGRNTPKSGQQTPRSGQQTPKSGQQTPRSDHQDLRSGQQTPRSGQQTPKSGQQTPRPNQQTPRSGQQTPKSGQQTPKSGQQTPRTGLQTPKSGQQTPRSDHQGLRSGQQTPRSGQQTPRSDHQSMRSGQHTPRSGQQTPRSGQQTPRSDHQNLRSGQQTPRSGQQTPRSGQQTPRSGQQTPRSGQQTPRSGQQTPRSGQQTPRSEQNSLKLDATRSGQSTPRYFTNDATPADSPRSVSDGNEQGANLIVAATSSEVQYARRPKSETDPSNVTNMPRESISEVERNLLDEVFASKPGRTPSGRPSISIGSANRAISPFDQQEMAKVPILIRLVAHAVCIAGKAGDIIRSVSHQSDLGISYKDAKELQTEADRSAQSCIVGSLARVFPDLTVIGEEGTMLEEPDPAWFESSQSVDVLQYVRNVPDDYRNIGIEDITVWVDPLDGTSDFVSKNLEVCTTLIGIAVKGKAIAGVIHQPFYQNQSTEEAVHEGRTVWGVQGMGVFGLDLKEPPADENIIVSSRRKHDLIDETLEACDPSDLMFVGGAGNKILLLLEGKAHALVYPLYGFMKWDTCATEAILRAAGGELTDLHGQGYSYHSDVEHDDRGGILAAYCREHHDLLVSKMPQHVLDQVPTMNSQAFETTGQVDANVPLITRLVAASVNITLKSGEIIRSIMSQGDLGIVEKGVNDLQTQADRSVEQCIMHSFRAQFPDVKVIGEEGQELDNDINPDWIVNSMAQDILERATKLSSDIQDTSADEVTVWVDPLDGTAEYTQGLLDHVTVLIGIAVRGRAVAGVIYQPYFNYEAGSDAELGRVIWGIVGLGSFGFEPSVPPESENIITTTRSHSSQTVQAAVDACEPTEVLRVGGAGHKVLLIIEGRAHAYVFGSPGCKKWDTCAPEAVLHATGGKLTDIHGNYYQYHEDVRHKNLGGVLATTTVQAHTRYASMIPDSVLDDLPTDGPAPWQKPLENTAQPDLSKVPLVTHLVAASVDIALKSGEIIREIMSQGDLGIVEKGINDLQTQADRSVEQCIMHSLKAQFPVVKVIGEEGQELDDDVNPEWIVRSVAQEVVLQAAELPSDIQDTSAEEVTVWVDPLDGTAEYTQGLLDHVTVLIGIAVRGRAVAGVIYQPYFNYEAGPDAELGRVIWGIVGLGSFGFEPSIPPESENIITTTRSHSSQTVQAAVDACEPTQVLRVGGAGHKVLLIIEGRAHAYVFGSPGCKKWDTCAPEAVLHATGGKLTDIHGNFYQYHEDVRHKNLGGVLATTTVQAHTRYASMIPDSVLDDLPTDGPAPWQKALVDTAQPDLSKVPLVTRIVAASVDIALKSGEIIREIMSQGDLGIVEKGVNDLQTQADRSVEQCIMHSLSAQFPDVKVIGEEGQELDDDVNPEWIVRSVAQEVLKQVAELPSDIQDTSAEEVTVWVDPLDGTAEYTQGLLDHVTVLIGIAVRGRAVAGVIYQPYFNYEAGPDAELGRVIWGIVGVGSFGFEPSIPPESENIITTTRSHSSQTVQAAVDACEPTQVLRVGGAGHKVLLIIEGRAHAYVFGSPGCKKWDTCAPEAVLHATGGKLTDIHGNFYQYHADVRHKNLGGVLATTTVQAHTRYASMIPDSVLDDLPTDGPAPWQKALVDTAQPDLSKVPLVTRLVAASVDIALKSGEIIREIMSQGDLGIVEKGINDLQTQADRSVEQCIMHSLKAQLPDVKVIGEEGQELDHDVNPEWIVRSVAQEVVLQAAELPSDIQDTSAEEVTVWVDPLDGTAEYTQGLLDHVTVLIGIAVRGRAVAGVIYQPYFNYQAGPNAKLGRVIWGIVGLGSFGFEPNIPPESENIITTTRSHSSQTVQAAVDACEPTEVLRVGGAGHKVLLIIEGRAHAYVFGSPGCKKWDTCAPEAVLHATGGKLTDIHGNYYQYHENVQHRNMGGVLATTTTQAHTRYASMIPDSVLDDLPTDGPAPWQLAQQVSQRLHSSTPIITRLTAACVDIACKAGEIIRQIHAGEDLETVEKGANDFQTKADRSSQRCILASLSHQFPHVKVIAEEDLDPLSSLPSDWVLDSQSEEVISVGAKLPDKLLNIAEDEITVFVDPLDGTRELVLENGQLECITVLIGIAVRAEPVAGVICQPFVTPGDSAQAIGRVVWGIQGIGAFGFPVKTSHRDENIIATSPSTSNQLNNLAVNACNPTDIERVSGMGFKALLLVEGRAHAIVKGTSNTHAWDTCAPDAILRALGGKMTDIRGQFFKYTENRDKNTSGILATLNPDSHAHYLQLIPDNVK